jgi:putative RNA 2'-phosphotransferase
MADLVRLSKFLAVMLRHRAADFGLMLDHEGYADLGAVWAQVEKRFPGRYIRADLDTIVAGDATGKRRYEIAGDRIRALYGHSAVTRIEYPPAEPPETLYHGTTRAALGSIRREGLTSQARQYVHLTTNRAIAARVADRQRDETIVLTIRAREAHQVGVAFYHPEAEHYLADAIPPQFIDLPPA